MTERGGGVDDVRNQVHHYSDRGMDGLLCRSGEVVAMSYEPKYWYPDDRVVDDIEQKAHDLISHTVEHIFDSIRSTVISVIDLNVKEAVEDHVKEGLLWIVYDKNDGSPKIEFTAFLGDEDPYPTHARGLRELFQEELEECTEDCEALWKALIEAYDDWKKSRIL